MEMFPEAAFAPLLPLQAARFTKWIFPSTVIIPTVIPLRFEKESSRTNWGMRSVLPMKTGWDPVEQSCTAMTGERFIPRPRMTSAE